jgi:hypothetical protein
MNYFMVHATTAIFVKAVDAPSSYSALIIGIPNISAAIVAAIHCWYGTNAPITVQGRFGPDLVRRFLMLGCASGAVGNAIHAMAYERGSIAWSLFGRFVVGLSLTEIVFRDVVASCPPSQIVSESARMILAKVAGVVGGLTLGTMIPLWMDFVGVGDALNLRARRLQLAPWLLALLWLVHGARIHVLLPSEESNVTLSDDASAPTPKEGVVQPPRETGIEDNDSDSSVSINIGTPSSILYGTVADAATLMEPTIVPPAYGSMNSSEKKALVPRPDITTWGVRNNNRQPSSRRGPRQWKVWNRLRKFLGFHIGIPLALTIFVFATLGLEVFFTATPMIMNRYFEWTGSRIGTLLTCLAMLFLPILWVSELVARRYEERTILKVSRNPEMCIHGAPVFQTRALTSVRDTHQAILGSDPGGALGGDQLGVALFHRPAERESLCRRVGSDDAPVR